MTDPKIITIERFGVLYPARLPKEEDRDTGREPMVLGECCHCGGTITDRQPYWKDGEHNLFCGRECLVEYYGIDEIEPVR